MIEVRLYGRKDCHLCEQVKADLQSLKGEIPHQVVEVDIDDDAVLRKRFDEEIPVVEIGPFTLKAPITRQQLHMTLGAAQDRIRHIERVENSPRLAQVAGEWTGADKFDLWLSRHYMLLINGVVMLYVGLAFLAPTLAGAGYTGLAHWLYRGYGLVCHQLGYRSFFIEGAQAYYPRAAAGIQGVQTFSQASGLGEGGSIEEVLAARDFIGNPQMGFKIALCERDIAIYLTILAFGLLFSLTGRRIPAIPWWLWLGLAILPIGLDGFSQLLSQPPLSLLPYRESTPLLRVLTGSLFGLFSAWFAYPLVEESFAETRAYKEAKLARWQKMHSGRKNTSA